MRMMPYDLDSETFLLAACFCRGGLEKAAKILTPEDFYSEGGQLIYSKMLKFHQSGRGFTISTIDQSFVGHPKYESISRILDSLRPVTAEVVTHFAKIVKEFSGRRKAIKATSDACEKLHDISNPLNEVVDFLKVEVCGLGTTVVNNE